MINLLLGKKKNMGQVFRDGRRISVTKVEVGPCIVTQIKTKKTDGYDAVQVGFSLKSVKNITKPLKGHLKGATNENKAPRFLKEVKVVSDGYKVGDLVKVSDVFGVGDVVAVSGVTKGKGFAGVVKRWNFGGSAKSHGQSSRLRAPGSIGQGTSPGRVRKGKKMGGHMGVNKVMIDNLEVIEILGNEMSISGSMPGARGSLLTVTLRQKGKQIEEKSINEEVSEDQESEKQTTTD